MRTEILRMEWICKSFQIKKILNNVNLSVFKGEILGLVGANGAGKTSLMKILAGHYRMDSGKIFFNEKDVDIGCPSDSQKLGICFIPQDLDILTNLSLAENVFLGMEKHFFISINDKKLIHEKAADYLTRVGIKADAHAYPDSLSTSQKQLLQISRVLARSPSLVILDEPTSSLTEKEIEILKTILNELRDNGASIIFISHKINEAIAISDRIAVLRDGASVGTYPKEECTENMLLSLMTGGYYSEEIPPEKLILSEEVLRVESISSNFPIHDISFCLHKGEILGLTGILGSGRTQLLEVLFGIAPKRSGLISINGNQAEIRKPLDAIRNKIGFVPENRTLQGLILEMSVMDNISLPSLQRLIYKGFLNSRMQRFFAKHYLQSILFNLINIEEKVKYLSGGNQQKVLISKWLSIKPEILILDEPTRGVDLSAKKEIHRAIRKLANEGSGILFASYELEEILAISDRILIMHKGVIKGELMRRDATKTRILSMALS